MSLDILCGSGLMCYTFFRNPKQGGCLPNEHRYMPGVSRREVMPMTAYEIVMIIIGIFALLVSFGGLIIAFLTFLDKRKR